MEFREITEKEKTKWDEFILRSSEESFLQSFDWGEFQKAAGKNVVRYAACEGDNIVCASLVVEHTLPLGLKYWYLPRGPVAYEKKENSALKFFLERLGEEARRKGIIFVRMDPACAKSDEAAFRGLGLEFAQGSVQPKDTLVLDLSKSEEELLAEMKQKTRYNIRLAEKKGVKVFSEKFDEKTFEKFWRLITETSERDGIVSHSREYYLQMVKTLSSKENGLVCRLYFAEYEKNVIAANIVLFFGTYAVYLHGASSNNFRNLMAPYLLQWQQIQDAKSMGRGTYDFWGITIDNENPKWAGITRFKKGFGGREVSYVGVLDMPTNKILYKLYLGFGKIRKA